MADLQSHLLAAAAPQEQEYALRGGLKGRFAGDFCVLQSSIEALSRYLETQTTPEVCRTAQEMLGEMTRRVIRLERLADNAAELALGGALGQNRSFRLVELQAYLDRFCDCVAEELVLNGLSVRLGWQRNEDGDFYLQGDPGLMDALLANLVSNSAAQHCSEILLRCESGASPDAMRWLLYRDNGPGLGAEGRLLLEQGALSRSLIEQGGTGLLLVRQYADALGWQIRLEQEPGFGLRFGLPPFRVESALEALRSEAGERQEQQRRNAMLAARVHREFAAVFGSTQR